MMCSTSWEFFSFAPVDVELLNLWNDFRKVVKFIDENPWVKPMLARIQSDKNTSVMCADMLPLAKAESPIGSYTDKDRVNHECILLFIVFIN